MSEPHACRRAPSVSGGRFRRRSAGSWRERVATTLVLSVLLMACGGKAVIDGAAGGGHGGGLLTVSLSNVAVVIGCKPGGEPPDPVDASLTATYDNGSAVDASALVVAATLSFGGPPSSLDWSFELSPASAGPVGSGDSLQLVHTKVAGSGSGDGLPCDFCSAPSPLLTVDYLVDGQYTQVATAGAALGCLK